MISNSPSKRAPLFEVIDQKVERADLARRRESKFMTPFADTKKLRRLLEVNCRCEVHNERVSSVRSVYFDDHALSACQANVDGLGSRRKLRIRWYDQLQPGRDFFAEVKWREGVVTGKARIQIRSRVPLHELPFRQWIDELQRMLPAEMRPAVCRYGEPVVLVEYRREHFIAEQRKLRITIDYDVAFYDQMGRQTLQTNYRLPLPGMVVIEGKTPVGRQSELPRLFYPLRTRATRCSKYVAGCQTIGAISRVDPALGDLL